jgi:hypothetical protein
MDTLSLGGITFDNFSTPDHMMGGGRQSMVVHKLPGGARVVDTLGPDEANVAWNGFFYGNNAYASVLALDALRASGTTVPLIFGGQYRSVIVESFAYQIRRLPVWIEYQISCLVYQNPSLGALGTAVASAAGSIDSMISSDLNLAAFVLGNAP